MLFAMPSCAVLTEASAPALQNCLKKTGKKPAMTVVANAELAQSQSAQAITGRRSSTPLTPRPPGARAFRGT